MDTSNPSGPNVNGLPRVGDVVAGKYEVERIIGEGGMGVVVAARHKQLGELVAVKLLHPTSALDGEAAARLIREAQATISIKSEHVVRVHDVGTRESGSPYIVMEYLKGDDLSGIVRAGGYLPIGEAIDYLLQACEAIAEAHARGIVHRDLKPSNLFLTQRADGSSLVKVLDFGISKALVPEDQSGSGSNPQASLTATRAVFGSPLYMSPEQVRSAKRVDERTDIWALGVILHELITGSLPFSGETMPGVLASIAADPPEALRVRRPEAPEGLEAVVLRCLVKDITQRFQTVAELATALAPYAPPGAELSVQRIVRLAVPGSISGRLSRPSGPPPAMDSRPSKPSSTPSRTSGIVPYPSSSPSLALGSTVKATTTSSLTLPRQPRYAIVVGGIGAGLLVVAVGLFVLVSRSAATPSAGPSVPASAPYALDPSSASLPAFTVPALRASAPASDPSEDAAVTSAKPALAPHAAPHPPSGIGATRAGAPTPSATPAPAATSSPSAPENHVLDTGR